MKMRNDILKHNSQKYMDVIGLNTLILLSTNLFPTNEDIKNYTDGIVKIELKEYLFKSRTMLVARVNRYIYDLEMDELKNFDEYINNYLIKNDKKNNSEDFEIISYKEKKNNTKKNKSKENLKTWLKNI